MSAALRSLLTSAGLAAAALVGAQHIDSVQVFRSIPVDRYTAASAEGTAWRLHHAHAPYVTIGPAALRSLNEELEQRRPAELRRTELSSLAYLGLVYSRGAVHVAGILGDLDVVVDLTARREIPLDTWMDRLELKALLVSLGL